MRQMLAVLEQHNPARKGHGERVASYSVATAHKLGCSEDELFAIRIAAALHDYGKTRIERSILEHSGQLEAHQLVEIRAWVIGSASKISKEVSLESVEPIIVSQYERYDGLGFPGKRKSNEIPIGARIVALCAAFDVMRNQQCWKSAKSDEDAIADINRNSATQFDPNVVAAFLSIQPLITPIDV
jgi:HD-GYP domain-containing protein (c-di-GMP phosphodiesterase class II)